MMLRDQPRAWIEGVPAGAVERNHTPQQICCFVEERHPVRSAQRHSADVGQRTIGASQSGLRLLFEVMVPA